MARLKALRPTVAGFHMICSGKGQPYSLCGFRSIRIRLQKRALAQGAIKERFTFHDIRAKTLTDADDTGKDAQQLAGHSKEQQTITYLRSRKVSDVEPVK